MTELTWLITGSSRGFGRALAGAALAAGDRVVATARNSAQVADLAEQYPGRALGVDLDVTDPGAVASAFESALDRFGRVDVVVNNAGYANVAPVETGPEDDFRRQFDTNFWGVYNVCRVALPVLRSLGGGTIIQFSSIGGRVGGSAGIGSYQAAKFAVDGLTRVLAAETAPLGIRYLVVEPGGFATDWAGASMQVLDIPAEYEQTVGTMTRYRDSATAPGDPERGAEILVRMVQRHDLPLHLLLGAGAVEMAQNYSRRQIAEADAWATVSRSADFDQDFPAEFPADPRPARG